MNAARQKGFTLIEVLVALTIVAVALFAGTQATTALARSSQRQTDLMLAQICIDNAFYALRLAKLFPDIGEREDECNQAGRAFVVQFKILPTPNPDIRKAEASVVDAEQKYGILQVSTIIGR